MNPGWRRRPLPEAFYARDTVLAARELLGKVLRVRDGRLWRSGMIVEDEAYLREDPASHAYLGPNRRNRSMFGRPGTAYVFTVHGVHCMNVVTQAAEAVLIRAVEPLENVASPTDGPGKVCRALGITRERHDGVPVTGPDLEILDGGLGPFVAAVSPRIGVTRAKALPLRFYVKDNRFVSRPRPGAQAR